MELDGRSPLGQGRQLVLLQPGLRHPALSARGAEADNEQALVFWWFASTCRHLGVGGKPAAAVWEADKRAMRTYLSLKRFYTQGEFYGIEETIHAHTLPDLRESVLNVFNLSDKAVEKEVRLHATDIGLPAGSMQAEGDSFAAMGEEITVKMTIPGMDTS